MERLILIILSIISIIGLIFFWSWLGMLIFNWVMTLFSCSFTLNYGQALAVCILLFFIRGIFNKR